MSTDKPFQVNIPGVNGPAPVAPKVPAGSQSNDVRGIEFNRILEELMSTAGNLDAKAAEPASADPKELKDAVEQAKQSLDAALSLGDNLLEAYRKAMITEQKPK